MLPQQISAQRPWLLNGMCKRCPHTQRTALLCKEAKVGLLIPKETEGPSGETEGLQWLFVDPSSLSQQVTPLQYLALLYCHLPLHLAVDTDVTKCDLLSCGFGCFYKCHRKFNCISCLE